VTYNKVWSAKHFRCNDRIKAGVKLHEGEILRFLTLNTPVEAKRDLTKAFHILYKRIKRLTVDGLIRDGYISNRQASFYYGKDKSYYDKLFRFDFLRVKSKGIDSVHLHILFYGQFIPFDWLYFNWKDVLGVDFIVKNTVDIKQCKKSCDGSLRNVKSLSSYCVNQYVAGQTGFMSWYSSRDWLEKDFLNNWNIFIDSYGKLRSDERFVLFWSLYELKKMCSCFSEFPVEYFSGGV